MIATPTGVKKVRDVPKCEACEGEHLALEFSEFVVSALPTGPRDEAEHALIQNHDLLAR